MPSSTSVAARCASTGPVPGMSIAGTTSESQGNTCCLLTLRKRTAMVKSSAHRADPRRSVFRERMNVLEVHPRLRKCARELVDEYRPREASTSDESTLRATDRHVVADDGESERTLRVRHSLLFLGEAEEEDVAGVAHHDCEGAFVVRDLFDGLSDLSDVRRSKDIAANRGGQKSFADKASVCASPQVVSRVRSPSGVSTKLVRLRQSRHSRAGSWPLPPPEICTGSDCDGRSA